MASREDRSPGASRGFFCARIFPVPCISRHRVSRCVENIEPGSAMSPRRRARFSAHHPPEIQAFRGESKKTVKHAVLRDRIRDANQRRHAAVARAVRIFGYVDVCCRMEKSPCGVRSRDVAMPLDPWVKLAYVCRADSGEMQHRRWPWSQVPSSMRERGGAHRGAFRSRAADDPHNAHHVLSRAASSVRSAVRFHNHLP